MTRTKNARTASNLHNCALLAAAVAGLGVIASSAQGSGNWSQTPVSNLWSNPNNWGGIVAGPGDFLAFDFQTSGNFYSLTNDLPADTPFGGLTFNVNATTSYNLSGNRIGISGTINNTALANHNLNFDLLLNGNLTLDPQNGTITINGAIAGTANGVTLLGSGNGVVILAGNNTYVQGTTVNTGTMILTGRIGTDATNANSRSITVGSTPGFNGALIINGGTLNANRAGAPALQAGGAPAAGGAIIMNSGTITTASEIWLAPFTGSYGAFVQNGGVVNDASFFALARGNAANNASTAYFEQNGGTLTVATNTFTLGSFQGTVPDLKAVAVFNAGVTNVVGGVMHVGENLSAQATIRGTAQVNLAGNNMNITNAANITGILNLNGGTLTAARITSAAAAGSTRILNLNGGTFLPSAGTTTLLQNQTKAYILGGGFIIDDRGSNNTITQSLLAPEAGGIDGSGLTVSGTGFVGAPLVVIGGDGTGATALAHVGTDGSLTTIEITSPGSGYTNANFTLIGGGGSGFVGGSPAFFTPASGGLTKRSGGILTLTGSQGGTGNTYTGPTTISGGLTLDFTAAASPSLNMISPSSALVLNDGVTLQITGKANTPGSQTFASTSLNNYGPTSLTISNSGTGTMVVNLGAVSRAVGSTMALTIPTSGSVTTTTPNANFAGGSQTILGGYVTVGGTTWAVSGNGGTPGVITGLTAYSTGFSAGTNVDVATGPSASGALSVNSIRINGAGAATVDATGGLTIATGGILETSAVGNNAVSISNGTITSNNGQDLIVIQNNAAGLLTLGAQVTGSIGLTKDGAGVLALTNAANNFSGKVYINGGSLQVSSDGALGTNAGSDSIIISAGTLQLGASANIGSTRGMLMSAKGGTINTNGFDSIYSGVISGPGPFTKIGLGKLTLAGNEAYTGVTTVNGGELELSGTDNLVSAANIVLGTMTISGAVTAQDFVTVANTANSVSVLKLSGGVLTAAKATSPTIRVGGAVNSIGIVKMASGTITTASQFQLGTGNAGAYAGMSMSGGLVTTGSFLSIGLNNDRAIVNLSGGALTTLGDYVRVAAGGTASIAILSVSGGTLTSTSGAAADQGEIRVGEAGYGVLNISGNGIVSTSNPTLAGLRIGEGAGSTGIVNLLGGTLSINRLIHNNNTSSAFINLNGGVLKANGDIGANAFIPAIGGASSTNIGAVTIWSGNATIDDSGFSLSVAAPLLAPTGSGISAVAVATGTGFVEAPVVQINGGSGTGATAIANLDGSGNLTGITMTNRGVGYGVGTTVPTISIVGGGGTLGNTNGTFTLASNIGGGLNKLGTGTLTLTSTGNNYSGATNVSSGLLRINGSLLGTGLTTVNGGAGLGGLGGTIAGPVTVVGGATPGTRGAIDLRDAATGTLTLNGGLTLGSPTNPSEIRVDLGGINTTGDKIVVGTTSPLVVNAGGAQVVINNLGGMAFGNSYTIMTYSDSGTTPAITLSPGSTQIELLVPQIVVSNTSVIINVTGTPAPTTAFWAGDISGIWNSIGAGNTTNWRVAASGNVDTHQLPDSTSDVVIGTTTPGAANLNMVPGRTFSVKSLTDNNASPVTIGGTDQVTIGSGGITVNPGAGGLTITTSILMNGNQTWTNNGAANPTTITGIISSASTNSNLTLAGNIILAGTNAYIGRTTINPGIVTLVNGAGLGPVTNTLAFGGSGGHLALNGTSATVGELLSSDTSSIIDNGSATNSTFTINSTRSTNSFAGTIQNGGSGLTNVVVTGTSGVFTLTGTMNIGALTVAGSRLVLPASGNITTDANNPFILGNVNSASGTNAGILEINGGSVTSNRATPNTSISVGNTAGSLGFIKMTSGTITTLSQLRVGDNATGFGALTVTGGTLNIGSGSGTIMMFIGFAGRGILNMSGGTLTVPTDRFSLGSSGNAGIGIVNFSGGTINVPAGAFGDSFLVGENAYGVVNMSGNAVLKMGTTMSLANNAAAGVNEIGIVNLAGNARIVTQQVGGRTGNGPQSVGIWNWHGGTLQATSTANGDPANALTNFFRPVGTLAGTVGGPAGISAYVWPEGGTIDDSGLAVTVVQSMLVPTGSGVAATNTTIAVAGGTGYIETPVVQINGGGGTGATALAVINGSGQLTGITITNPGVGYTGTGTNAPVATFFGGGGTTATFNGFTLVSNATTGGLTKVGLGSLTLSGTASTYQGPTNINQGVLRASANINLGSITSPGAVNLNSGTLESTASFTLANGTINRNITVTTLGGTLSPVAGTTLTVPGSITGTGALSIAGAGKVNLTGNVSYGGAIGVNGGFLTVGGTLGGTGSLIVNSGGSLGGVGAINMVPSVLAGGAVNLSNDGTLGTLTVANGLSIDGGNMVFDLGGLVNGADKLSLGSSTLTIGGSGSAINFNTAGGVAPGNYTLATFGFITNPAGVTLASQMVGGSTVSLNVTASQITVTVNGAAVPTTAFWAGAIDGLWQTVSTTSGIQTNWRTDGTNNTDTQQIPGNVSNVVFATTNPPVGPLATTLGGNMVINSVTVAPGTGDVSIGDTTSTLTLVAFGTNGLTVGAGASLTISANLTLVGPQTWSNVSTTPTNITGVVTGTGKLTIVGNTFLGRANALTGGIQLNSGTLSLGNNAALGGATNTFAFGPGSNGVLQVNSNNATVGGIAGDNTAAIENGGPTAGTFTLNASTGTNTFSGALRDGIGGGTLSVVVTGGGSLTLGGTANYTGNTTLTNGRLILTSGAVLTLGPSSLFTAGGTAGVNGVLEMAGGTVTTSGSGAANIFSFGTVANSSGAIKMSSGLIDINGSITFPGWRMGGIANGYGGMTMTGGNVSSNTWILLGQAANGIGVWNQAGGTLTPTGGFYLDIAAGAAGSFGDAQFSGNAVYNGPAGLRVGGFGIGILNVSNNALVNVQSAAAGQGLILGAQTATASGVVNLRGGTITTNFIARGTTSTNTGIINFNGGVLMPSINSTTFMAGLTSAIVWPGGATINDNGLTITIAQPLISPSGSGIATIPVTSTGSGYVGTPYVNISGGGTGASAIANVDASGNLSSITITNPGTGYTAVPTVTVLGGGGTGLVLGTPTIAANPAAGNLMKAGTGTVILTGASTFTGNTTITAGTLDLNNGSALGNSIISNISAGAALVFDSAVSANAFIVGGLSGNFNLALQNNAAGAITLLVGNNTTSTTYGGVLSGGGSLVKVGTGTTTLTGANTYTGGTTFNGGFLAVGAPGTLPAGTFSFGGGSLRYTAANTTDYTPQFSQANNQAYSVDTGGQVVTFATPLNSTGGTFTKLGTGSLIMAAANLYTGATSINGGVLVIAANNNIGNPASGAALNINGGTLQTANTFALDNAGANKRNVVIGATGANFNLTGANTLTVSGVMSGNGPMTASGAGSTLLIAGAANFTGQVNVSANTTVEFGGSATHNVGLVTGGGNLQVDAGAKVNEAANASLTNRTGRVTNLKIGGAGPTSWTGLLNLRNNNMIITNGSDVQSQIKQGANLGAWTGTGGITSSSAQSAATGSTATALGYASGTDFTAGNGQTAFDGQTFNGTDVLVKYTLAGDGNMDGSVTFADFLQLQNNYNQAGTNWEKGDWNYDGSTTFADFLILQNNYTKVLAVGSSLPSGGGASSGAVPEPASLAVLALGGAALLTRRRRR